MTHPTCDATVVEPAFHRFPAEVLGEVFAQALEDDITDPSPESMKQLIDICLVCREWCDTAKITHTLWRTLSLPDPLSSQTLEKARRWLGRAKTLPKGLAVVAATGHRGHCHHRSDCSLASRELANMLMEGSMDFHHLTITCPSSVCFYQLLTLFEETRRRNPLNEAPRPWENVKSLSFNFFDDWNQWEDFQDPSQDILTSVTYPIFVLLPPITSLSLHLPSIHHENEAAEWVALNIPENILENLTDMTLVCDWLPRKVLKVLEGCRSVERLTLDLNGSTFVGDGGCAGFDDKATLLPRVRQLRIRQLVPQALEYLRYFRTPLLEELDLGFMNVGQQGKFQTASFLSMEAVISLFQRSRCADTLSVVRLRHAFPMDAQRLQIRLPFMSKPHFSVNRCGNTSRGSNSWTLSRARS
ncbi:hypothetical protein FA13DRAFT_839262 [Coprinellus micaceus]|uniref:Uncharacterized protein n=1 Tax=Coprinellus micaceus TaxID=71717 RepID=A0A4Y7T101_COPMI|nr:hypothetical protein FA13DRAFT_839262 [Coprinellus micaceus]